MPWKDRLPGGLADDKTPTDFEPDAVLKGMGVEMEHTKDKRLAVEIALDHLTEDPRYYEKLETIETHDGDIKEPSVKLAKPRSRVFIEGDELLVELGSIADELFSRGADGLGNDTLGWLKGAVARTKRKE